MKGDQISIQEARIYSFFSKRMNRWYSNRDVADLLSMSYSTVKSTTRNWERIGVLKKVDGLALGFKYLMPSEATNSDYLNRLKQAEQIFAECERDRADIQSH